MNNKIVHHGKFILLIIALSSLPIAGDSQQNRDSVAVMERMHTFLNAFNTFNWKVFRDCFADDATMFHPFWNFARRRTGKEEVETAWREIFPEFSDSANSKRMNLLPKDMLVQLYDKTAIVTFHLGDGISALSRRTFVWVQRNGEWRIVHLHASNIKSN